jgi:hypothetical protein
MRRSYRRPGLARAIDDIFAPRIERRPAGRISPGARRDRLSRLISKLTSQDDPMMIAESVNERRTALRLPADERPFEASAAEGERHVIWLEDVSRSGMRFRSLCPFVCGSVVTIHAPKSLDLAPMRMRLLRTGVVDPMIPERGFEFAGEFLADGDEPHRWYLATRAKR